MNPSNYELLLITHTRSLAEEEGFLRVTPSSWLLEHQRATKGSLPDYSDLFVRMKFITGNSFRITAMAWIAVVSLARESW